MNIEFARLQSVSDLVMEVDITSQGVWKSLSLLIQCTDAGLIAILFTSPLREGDSNFLGAKIPDLFRISKIFAFFLLPKQNFVQMRGVQ